VLIRARLDSGVRLQRLPRPWCRRTTRRRAWSPVAAC